ncbi:GGDEF domain-containing protein [Thalassospira povalilytica]|uniref:diguanylate cyclase n=2 Tax=Thalassospira povalilytica TaxID=732237 RepID=A0ABX4R806_9PROT|nr:GGDEF domain-containing protein [Thalassospira povalilytica]
MAQLGVIPHPDNFLIFYSYLAGTNPDMNQTIDILRSNHRAFDELQCKAIHDRFFSTERERKITEQITTELRRQLNNALNNVKKIGVDTTKYAEALDHFCDYISSKDFSNLEQSLHTLVGATRQMEDVSHVFGQSLDSSSTEISRLRQDLAKMRHEAMTDGLTGIANRKAFDEKLREEAMTAMESGKPVSLLILDIDHFKSFNDNHGHQVGDQVLRLMAEALERNVKGQDFAARYGGEEFAIILPQTTLGCAKQAANMLRHNVETHNIVSKSNQKKVGRITVSIGVATFRFGEPLARLIERADDALYLAKSRGRNQVASERDVERDAQHRKDQIISPAKGAKSADGKPAKQRCA